MPVRHLRYKCHLTTTEFPWRGEKVGMKINVDRVQFYWLGEKNYQIPTKIYIQGVP